MLNNQPGTRMSDSMDIVLLWSILLKNSCMSTAVSMVDTGSDKSWFMRQSS